MGLGLNLEWVCDWVWDWNLDWTRTRLFKKKKKNSYQILKNKSPVQLPTPPRIQKPNVKIQKEKICIETTNRAYPLGMNDYKLIYNMFCFD